MLSPLELMKKQQRLCLIYSDMCDKCPLSKLCIKFLDNTLSEEDMAEILERIEQWSGDNGEITIDEAIMFLEKEKSDTQYYHKYAHSSMYEKTINLLKRHKNYFDRLDALDETDTEESDMPEWQKDRIRDSLNEVEKWHPSINEIEKR